MSPKTTPRAIAERRRFFEENDLRKPCICNHLCRQPFLGSLCPIIRRVNPALSMLYYITRTIIYRKFILGIVEPVQYVIE